MYQNDSFHTLTAGGQIGLLFVTLCLTVLLVLAIWRLCRGRGWPFRIAAAVLSYGVFVWLSPQIYYAYYLLIFDDLPLQLVVGWPPWADIWRHPLFAGDRTLSAHGQGLLFWGLIAAAAKARGPAR